MRNRTRTRPRSRRSRSTSPSLARLEPKRSEMRRIRIRCIREKSRKKTKGEKGTDRRRRNLPATRVGKIAAGRRVDAEHDMGEVQTPIPKQRRQTVRQSVTLSSLSRVAARLEGAARRLACVLGCVKIGASDVVDSPKDGGLCRQGRGGAGVSQERNASQSEFLLLACPQVHAKRCCFRGWLWGQLACFLLLTLSKELRGKALSS